MPFRRLSRFLEDIRRSAIVTGAVPLSDAQLLESYVVSGDEAGFEALVRRYGTMVFAVCQRLLSHQQDAEDAFQATFLVLVSKAKSLRRREAVGNWLYGVAVRTALQARLRSARRRVKEAEVPPMPPADSSLDNADQRELLARLDLELSRLPDKFRTPIVLCDLLGKTMRQAAEELGCPQGTVSSRLTRGREMLKKRLDSGGTAPSSVIGAPALGQVATQPVPLALCKATAKTCLLFAKGSLAAAGGLSPNVAALFQGVMKTMLLSKLKLVLALTVAVSLLGGATSWFVLGATGGKTPGAVLPAAAPRAGAAGVRGASPKAAPKAEEAAPRAEEAGQAKKLPLLYGGKDFNAWRDTLLSDLKPEVRVEALHALTAFAANGYAAEVTALVFNLMKEYDQVKTSYPNRKVLVGARETLAEIGPSTLPTLAKELESANANDRRLAAATLANMMAKFPKESLPLLLRFSKDADEPVRSLLLEAFLGIFPRDGKLALDMKSAEKNTLAMLLSQGLVATGKRPDNREMETAAKALAWLGPDAKGALPALAKALTNQAKSFGNWKLILDAIVAIGPGAKDEAVAILVAAVNQGDSTQFRQDVMETLGDFGGNAAAAVPVLIRIVKQEPGVSLRSSAIRCLGKIGPAAKSAVPALIAAIEYQPKDDTVKKNAVGKTGDAGGGNDDTKKKNGIDTTGGFGEAKKKNAGGKKGGGGGGMGGFGGGTPTISHWVIAQALGEIGPDAHEAVPSLIKMLNEDENHYYVIVALGRIGPASKEAVPALVEVGLKPRDTVTRLATVKALGNIGPGAKEAVPAILEVVAEIPQETTPALEELRQAANAALEKIRN